jgi:hypothetical protein
MGDGGLTPPQTAETYHPAKLSIDPTGDLMSRAKFDRDNHPINKFCYGRKSTIDSSPTDR